MTPGRLKAWKRGDTGHKHIRWDEMGDENVHAVFEGFHSFKNGKIYYLLLFKEKKSPKWNIKFLHYRKKYEEEERNK